MPRKRTPSACVTNMRTNNTMVQNIVKNN
jgi:hypothetical protein